MLISSHRYAIQLIHVGLNAIIMLFFLCMYDIEAAPVHLN